MRIRRLWLVAILLGCVTCCFAQRLTAMRDSVRQSYNFWFYEPTDQSVKDSMSIETLRPLIVFLHGKSLSGNDLQMVRRYGTISALEMGIHLDAFVLAPQTSNGWSPLRLMRMIQWTCQHYPVDTTRIYVLGMSMGGYGTIDLATAYPDKIAAAIAMCGGGSRNTSELCSLTQVPLWIIHGTADRSVPVSASDRVVNAIKECGDTTRLLYDRMAGQNHSILARVFYMDEAYEWLMQHSLTDSARVTNHNYSMTVPMLTNAYKHLHGRRAHITMVNGSRTADTYAATGDVYVVKQGDTLYGIARRYNTSVKNLCQLNNISETSVLSIGQRLKVR